MARYSSCSNSSVQCGGAQKRKCAKAFQSITDFRIFVFIVLYLHNYLELACNNHGCVATFGGYWPIKFGRLEILKHAEVIRPRTTSGEWENVPEHDVAQYYSNRKEIKNCISTQQKTFICDTVLVPA